jgi:hypothetical protein
MSVDCLEAVYRPLDALRYEPGQPFAEAVQGDQCEGRQQPFITLLQAARTYLGLFGSGANSRSG